MLTEISIFSIRLNSNLKIEINKKMSKLVFNSNKLLPLYLKTKEYLSSIVNYNKFNCENHNLFSKPFNHFNNFFIKIFFLSVFNYIINRAGPFKLTLEPSSYHC